MIGSLVVGSVGGLIIGWILGAMIVKGWGDLVGILIGKDGLGNQWADASSSFIAILGTLIGAGCWTWTQFIRVRRFLEERDKSSPPSGEANAGRRP